MPGAKPDERKTWYACSFSGCSRIFTSTGLLERHSLIHQTFTAGGLKAKTNHKNKCLLCPASFPSPQGLITHLYSHTGQRPFKCEFENCTGEFVQLASLHRHYKEKHYETKKYKCPHCETTVHQKYKLATHIRIHTGEKPYSCSVCNTKHTCRTVLNQHLKTKAHKREMMKKSSKGSENYTQLSETTEPKKVIMAENLSVKLQTLSSSEISQHISPSKLSPQKSEVGRSAKKRLTLTATVRTKECNSITKKYISKRKKMRKKKIAPKVVKKELAEQNGESSEEESLRRYSCPHCDMSYSAQVILDFHLKSHLNADKQRKDEEPVLNGKTEENSTKGVAEKTENFDDNANECNDEDIWDSASAIQSISADELSDNEGEEQRTANSLLAPLEIPCKMLNDNEVKNADSFTMIDEKNDFYKAIVVTKNEAGDEIKPPGELHEEFQSSNKSNFTCQDCGKVARNYYLLYRHIQTHKQKEKRKERRNCGENSSTTSSVNRDVKSVMDDLCNATIALVEQSEQLNFENLNECMETEDRVPDELVGSTDDFTSRGNGVCDNKVELKVSAQMKVEVKVDSVVSEAQSRSPKDDRGIDKSLICTVCSKIFCNPGNVSRHMKSIHKEIYKSLEKGQKKELNDIKNKKTEETPETADIHSSVLPNSCNNNSSESADACSNLLKRELDVEQSGLNGKMKNCDLCGERFTKMFALRLHMKKVHYGVSSSSSNIVASTSCSSAQPAKKKSPEAKKSSKPKGFDCIHCSRKLRSQFALDYHTTVMHPVKVETIETENVQVIAKKTKIVDVEDGKVPVALANTEVFAKKTKHADPENMPVLAQKAHLSSIFQCSECSKFCRSNMSLKRHMKIAHKKMKGKKAGPGRPGVKNGHGSPRCTECGKWLSSTDSLRRHMMRIHNFTLKLSKRSRGGAFKCTECDNSFSQRYSLQRHLKTQHNIQFAKKSSPFHKSKGTGEISGKSVRRENSRRKEKKEELSVKLRKLADSLCIPCSVYMEHPTTLRL